MQPSLTEAQLLSNAVAGDENAFRQLVAPLRGQVQAHCYRMLGSYHDAEEQVQETFLKAWRALKAFEGRGSFKAWIISIATRSCLNAIARRKYTRRALPDQNSPSTDQMPDGTRAMEIAWLEPYPESVFDDIIDDAPDAEARISSRQSVQLAFVAAIQLLPPRQRAALLLCDVLGWAAAETASLLGTTTAAINSALQRARETLARKHPSADLPATAVSSAEQKSLLERYMRAWESLDIDGFVALLREDAIYTMPPLSQWYQGPVNIGKFFNFAWSRYDAFKLVPAKANGDPAFCVYSRSHPDEAWSAHSIHVLSFADDQIARLTLFVKPTAIRIFEDFGQPLTI